MTPSVCLWVTLLLSTAAVCLSYGSLKLGPRSSIVGGEDAPPGRWPWMVYLHISNGRRNFKCGGSLVNHHWLLTAAHCLEFKKGKIDLYGSFAWLGALKLADKMTGERIRFHRVLLHPEYHGNTLQNDIALIQLKRPVRFSKTVATVKLPGPKDVFSSNSECWVTGWGKVTVNRPLGGDQTLQQVKLPLVDNSICRNTYRYITNNQLCAGGEPDKDSCQGDSGGPLVCKSFGEFVQVGVVSYGIGCGFAGIPGVYTHVSSYMQFIKDSIHKYPKLNHSVY